MNIEEIKQALAAATPLLDKTLDHDFSKDDHLKVTHLLTNAPTWIAQLLEEREVINQVLWDIYYNCEDEWIVNKTKNLLESIGELP